MGFFKSGAEKELDTIIQKLEMNMSNNYKDNAQENLKELEAAFATMCAMGALKPNVAATYESIISSYREKMKGYSHKDQKPFWT
jgi:ribosomal protein S20